jgi:hypothetical protein
MRGAGRVALAFQFLKAALLGASCPELCRNAERTDLHICPPIAFISMSMQVLMVFAAKRYRKFVADLSSELN